MAPNPSADFSLRALYLAIDAQRQARGLTWEQAVREINLDQDRLSARLIGRSTVTGLRTRAVAEGDGVLQMLRWLGRTAESFVPGWEPSGSDPATPTPVPSHLILRFDTAALHRALDARRAARGMTWREVAREIGGVSAPGLVHMKIGGRTGFPHVVRIARWLGEPVARFTRILPLQL